VTGLNSGACCTLAHDGHHSPARHRSSIVGQIGRGRRRLTDRARVAARGADVRGRILGTTSAHWRRAMTLPFP
jgi:hypothetical protein